VQDREILPEGVEDFPVLHFLPVFDFISHFYQLFLVSCLFVNLSWRPIEIFPAGVWDFSVLPSYRCLILFLTNFPILYLFPSLDSEVELRNIESNTDKSARQGNLRHPGLRFQSFADEAREKVQNQRRDFISSRPIK
jgi:hypothetical protein